ncbi:MBL fold metallo-hydrolase [Dehalobacter sp. DCM]|uniref:MBL fold metallo-hydrolase n=1 Tax=Dehalobacter sp. DCM TaxID=2907827 RepID=UPI0030817B5A|nr:MBL fold metallo-hydrolase [Dehalobacter sp. DCM]
MYFATLASGSSGNAILVGQNNRSLMVDCGIATKRILANLDVINIAAGQLEGIVITHEHSDHIKGVGTLARKLKIPVYATAGLWDELEDKIGTLRPEQKNIIGRSFELAGMKINLFATSHDSRESYGLKIISHDAALGIATDSGMITEEMHRHLQGCDAYVVEANHDVERLWQGRYPYHLKKRVSGNRGHLSNVQLAEGLIEWLDENTKKVVLAHLSEENNTPQIALATVVDILRDSRIRRKCQSLKIRVAPRHCPHELIDLSS